MIRIGLRRLEHTDDGTFGVFILPQGAFCYSLELPWKDNQRNVSCIPLGEYLCTPRFSNKFGKTYHVQNVPDRSYILIHAGNLGGDTSLGRTTHLAGCIAPGQYLGTIEGQRAVLSSRSALSRLHSALGWKDFTLVVEDESCCS